MIPLNSRSSVSGARLPILDQLSDLEDDDMSTSTVSAGQPIFFGPLWHVVGMDPHAYMTKP